MVIKIFNYLKCTGLFLVGILVLFSCEKPDPGFTGNAKNKNVDTRTIAEYILSAPDSFSYFLKILETGNLISTLSAHNPKATNYTLFLPVNDAVDKFIKSSKYGSLEDLLNDRDYALQLGKYTIVCSEYGTNDFPFGALPDTTGTGNYLTIGFESGNFKVNNYATILRPNIRLINGYIHVINSVLQPITFTSYEWLKENPDFSIFTSAMELTGLNDTINDHDKRFTLLIEPDSIFNKYGIYTPEDLIARYSPSDSDYRSTQNGLYQFVAYHILVYVYFLNDFVDKVDIYNTYAKFPIHINGTGLDIVINNGVKLIAGTDTAYSVGINYDNSNSQSLNGSIHLLTNLMELFEPRKMITKFEFYNEPELDIIKNDPGNHTFIYQDKFKFLHWSGAESLIYYKSSTSLIGVQNNDYISIEGNFNITYTTPKLLPGQYRLLLNAHAKSSENAIIQIFVDNKRLGGNLNLAFGATGANSFNEFQIGTVEYSEYESHVILVKSLIPGVFRWDYVGFQPL